MTEEIKAKIRNRIEDIVVLHGGRKAVSDETGVAQKDISKWLNGICTPSLDSLIAISQRYSISLDYLAGLAESNVLERPKRSIFDWFKGN